MTENNLHFNMLLLNQLDSLPPWSSYTEFTFQYASIKPNGLQGCQAEKTQFTFQYASIKPFTGGSTDSGAAIFTFQYASIKP